MQIIRNRKKDKRLMQLKHLTPSTNLLFVIKQMIPGSKIYLSNEFLFLTLFNLKNIIHWKIYFDLKLKLAHRSHFVEELPRRPQKGKKVSEVCINVCLIESTTHVWLFGNFVSK